MVLCVDEKSGIQTLDRTSPVLPLLPSTPERRTHDYRRHDTTNLYAALDVASGKVITDLTARHRGAEFQRFLNLINREVPDEADVHVIVDNSSTHKTPSVQRGLVRHPRFHMHFRPTYSSWLSLVSSAGSRSSPTNGCAGGRAPLHQRARARHAHLSAELEQGPQTVYLAQNSR